MALKDKARKSSGGSLAKKAKDRGLGATDMGQPQDTSENNLLHTMPNSFNASPPPPPALQYLRLFAQIPSLRKNNNQIL